MYLQSRRCIKQESVCKQKVSAETVILSKVESWCNGEKLQYAETAELDFSEKPNGRVLSRNVFI